MHGCEGIRSPGTGAIDSCELSCRCWKSSPGPLEKQSMLQTTEPSLQPPKIIFICCAVVFVVSLTKPSQPDNRLHMKKRIPLVRLTCDHVWSYLDDWCGQHHSQAGVSELYRKASWAREPVSKQQHPNHSLMLGLVLLFDKRSLHVGLLFWNSLCRPDWQRFTNLCL